jgi:hypothetical protein
VTAQAEAQAEATGAEDAADADGTVNNGPGKTTAAGSPNV